MSSIITGINPFTSLWALLDSDRWSWGDIWDAVKTPTVIEPPDDEVTLAEVPETPHERLMAWCEDLGVELLDFRDLALWPRKKEYDTKTYGWPKNKGRGHPYGSRDIRLRNTFMLHTTAVPGMNRNRGLGIPAHALIPEEEAISLLHQIERLLAHANTANKFTYGCEVSGKSDWDTQSQIDRARRLIVYFKESRERQLRLIYDEEGEELKHLIMPHRFSHKSRVNDCGYQIWRDCGEWAIEEHGFYLGPVVGSGRSLPAADVGTWKGQR